MSVVSKHADGADRVRKDLERATIAKEDEIEQLENKLKVHSNNGVSKEFSGCYFRK